MTSKGQRWWGCALGVGTLLLMGLRAGAATFVVDATSDAPDVTPGDGACATAAGTCTLRAAVQETNGLAGADAVTLPAGMYRLPAGQLDVTDDLTITGAGMTVTKIDGRRRSRVLAIASGSTVTLAALRIQNGLADLGGAIFNEGRLQLADVTLRSNRVTGMGLGGGLYTNGSAQLSGVVVERNRAVGCGGGIFNDGGVVIATDTTVASNRAGNSGGGLFGQSGSIRLARVTISGNGAGKIGGGVFNYDLLSLTNVTVSGNRALYGGGVFSRTNVGADLVNVTLAGNRARLSGGGMLNDGTVRLAGTIVADNSPSNCGGDPITSLGFNLDGATTCGFAAPGDRNSAPPRLARLRSNGGRTKTQALSPGSPAIDAGGTSCPDTDQRGNLRAADGNGDGAAACDIGAYEAQP